jgi:polysaccharide biosynthesis/export protein
MKRTSLLAPLCLFAAVAIAQTPVDNAISKDAASIADSKTDDTQAPATPQVSGQRTAPMIKLGAGDLVEMKVFGVPEMTQETRVNGGGDITVTLVGPVHVEGLTSTQAERLIEAKLVEGGYLKDPHVALFVKEYVTQGISVLGEVQKPGIYPMLGARRLYDALSSAGGMTNKAGRVVTITHRNDAEHPQIVNMDPDPAKSATSNVEIQPGDTIVVSKAGVVYVVGAVERPGGFIMDNNESLTVLQAMALAYGTKSTASLDKSKIIRKDPTGLKEIPISLNKVLEGKSTDIALKNDDILFIPASAAKGAFRRTTEAVIQAATGVAIYRR